MLVAVPVIVHGAALSDGPCVRHGEAKAAVLSGDRRGKEQLQGVDAFSRVPAAGGGDVVEHTLLRPDPGAVFLLQEVKHAVEVFAHVGRGEGAELEHCASAEDGVEHAEIRVLRGGGDEGDAAVFDEIEEGLLLLLVEVLDLVQIEQHALRREEGIELVDDGLYIRDAGGGGVQAAQRPVRPLGDDPRDGGLARAGGSVEDHIGYASAVRDAAQHTVRAEDMLLPGYIVEGLGPQLICQRAVSGL